MKLRSGIKKRANGSSHRNRRFFVTAPITALLMFSLVTAQSEAGLDHSQAQVTRSESGHPLTPASAASPEGIATGYLRSRGRSESVLNSLRTTNTNTSRGVTHVRMEQQLDGLSVYGGYMKAAVNANGELIHMIDHLYGVTNVIPGHTDAGQALGAAMANLYPSESANFRATGVRGNTTSFDGGAFFYGEPTVTAAVIPIDNGTFVRGWLVQTWTAESNELSISVVDGNGRVLDVENRTANDSYNVFTEDPGKGGQTTVPGQPGWLGAGAQKTINIIGSNAHAYLDVDANNAPDSGGATVSDGNFLTAADLGVAPTTTANRAVAVQNLFYFNNRVHDILYAKGFDEAAGNFQGNDPVNAEAQDGSGTDNANFSTPNDGSSPRMQMYLWTGVGPDAFIKVNATDYGANASAFGPAISVSGINGQLASYVDGTDPTSDACQASTVSLSGKVAILDRGTCNFTDKVLNAQKAGAIAAIIVNNVAGNPFGPGGTDKRIKIPSAMVSLADGTTIRSMTGAASNLRKNPVTALQIDGDIDADIVFHEYGHGLTWRMIGGMSGKLAGALGEGASDVNAFLINGDPVIGEYAFSNPAGIRRYPYDNYDLTYKAVDGAEVHNDGEIYAAAMWRVYQNYLVAGLSAEDLQGDWVDGMGFTPATPKFEDMRDGLLQAAALSPGRACLVWKGFASIGIGVNSASSVSRRGVVTITESFALPAGCN
jgi:extracellular elastinolytic metalloproteinase